MTWLTTSNSSEIASTLAEIASDGYAFHRTMHVYRYVFIVMRFRA